MSVIYRDRSALRALRPLEMAVYLRAHGWQEVQQAPDKGLVWRRSDGADMYEILLPLNHDLADYLTRLAQAVESLAASEARSPLAVWEDLTTAGADVVCAAVLRPDSEDGTLPLEAGVGLIDHAHDLMLAGACAAVRPRATYGSRKPSQAMEYVSRLRLGQTRRGSYAVTILSRIPQGLAAGPNEDLFGQVEEPFDRRATAVVARALAAVQTAAERAAATGRLDAFQVAIPQGVSANLCQALVGMAGNREAVTGLRFDFSWSPSRPQPDPLPQSVHLPADALPIIAEAGRILRETSPQEEFVLRGMVVRLDRPEGTTTGRIAVLGFVDGQPRRVLVDLGEADYNVAIQAHQERQPISCTGELVRDGRLLVLRNPRQFALEPLETLL